MDRIAKRVYVGECAGNHSLDRTRKRWIDTEGVFKEKRFGVRQAKRMAEFFVRRSALGIARGMNPRP